MTRMLSKSEWEEIMQFERLDDTGEMGFDFPTSDDWERVYCEGQDCKYGTQMVSRKLQMRRSPSFTEFYSGGIVD